MKKKMMKRGNFGMRNQMGTKSAPIPNSLNNPILLLNSFPALAETSLETQTETVLTLGSSHTSLIGNLSAAVGAIGNQFAFIVNVIIYSPSTTFQPMAVFDTVTNSAGVKTDRLYHQAFQTGFGANQNAYQHSMFYLSNLPPLSNDLVLTVKHPACQRRVVTVDQFVNLAINPLDQQALVHSTNPGTIQITSGQTATTSQPFELIYGSIAIGRNFNQFSEPQGFIPIQSAGTNIDSFDATLKTYYQLSAVQDKFGLSALISNSGTANFVWSAAVQTFKAIML